MQFICNRMSKNQNGFQQDGSWTKCLASEAKDDDVKECISIKESEN